MKKFDSSWFTQNILPQMQGYSVERLFQPEGDYGDLDLHILESIEFHVEVRFWDSGTVHVVVIDRRVSDIALETLLLPEDNDQREAVWVQFCDILNLEFN